MPGENGNKSPNQSHPSVTSQSNHAPNKAEGRPWAPSAAIITSPKSSHSEDEISLRLNNIPDPANDQAVFVEAVDAVSGNYVRIMYSNPKAVGSGSFGMVFVALLDGEHEVAIKKVLQDKRYKNRELQILRELRHPNIVSLLYFFRSFGSSRSKEIYLNLVQEFIPQTLSRVIKHYGYMHELIPISYVRMYGFQMIRGLAYVHSRNICHRDIKPQNLLVNPETGVLKICDFGSTKVLVPGEPNVSYICSRYYRAPELMFGATQYSVRIDMWSAGCVIGELLLGRPLFPGKSGVDQLVEIIKVLGTPTLEQVKEMNPHYSKFAFPTLKGCTWEKLITHRASETAAFDLLRSLLVYGPTVRQSASDALAATFFSDIISAVVCPERAADTKPSPRILVAFSEEELAYFPTHLAAQIRLGHSGPAERKLSSQSNANNSVVVGCNDHFMLRSGSTVSFGASRGAVSGSLRGTQVPHGELSRKESGVVAWSVDLSPSGSGGNSRSFGLGGGGSSGGSRISRHTSSSRVNGDLGVSQNKNAFE